jgi:ketosteroid isomerase-like protein
VSDIVDILDRGYQLLWREGRVDDALRGLPPDFEWVVPDHPEGAVRHGPEAVIEFFRDWIEPFDDLHVNWQIEEVAPGRALAQVDVAGRGQGSGARVEMHFAQLWTFSGRIAQRMVLYYDVDEARRDAGL